jgi:hypothetical protein
MQHASEPPICRRAVAHGLAALTLLDLSPCATSFSPVPSAASSRGPSQDTTPGADIDTLVSRLTWGANDTKLESRPLADLLSDTDGLRKAVEAAAAEDYRAALDDLMARRFDLSSSALDSVYPGVKPRDLGLV